MNARDHAHRNTVAITSGLGAAALATTITVALVVGRSDSRLDSGPALPRFSRHRFFRRGVGGRATLPTPGPAPEHQELKEGSRPPRAGMFTGLLEIVGQAVGIGSPSVITWS